MITVLNEGLRRARRSHQCFDCYSAIVPGEEYAFQSNVCDGQAYTICQHLDCRDLARKYRADAGLYVGDYDEGFPPLKDEWGDSGEHDALCDAYRGHFPHVVCRFELGEQKADIRMADRLRTLTEGARS